MVHSCGIDEQVIGRIIQRNDYGGENGNLLPCTVTQMNLTDIMLSEKPDRKTFLLHDSIYMEVKTGLE